MTAHIITSEEAMYNVPSVFMLFDSEFYGCNIYPKSRNFPISITYWKNTTSSDADRYFNVQEVEISVPTLERIKTLQSAIDINEKMAQRKSFTPIPKDYNIRRGFMWERYKGMVKRQDKAKEEDNNRVRPFESAMYAAQNMLRALLIDLTKQN